MATRVENDRTRTVGVGAVRTTSDETKAAFKTTEMLTYIATVAGVLIAAALDDAIDARLAWILIAALTIGYMLSRGFAKSERCPSSTSARAADERTTWAAARQLPASEHHRSADSSGLGQRKGVVLV